ncbi:cupin domain-containing protein [Cytobacillus oceanisediminis]|uniref:cupin domain-containing protein n=1 Tax=Cytobacillus oceanisediminis TaxID=665099 RepID=UPI001C2414BA|nr:cupin domain-containing protein [Cytobacillus oceanisediminis]MBU8730693.1 cupin domain-containing protein [Cytobacillus oceanisediminis]
MNSQTQTFQLGDDGQIPNNPDLPVIIYKAVFKEQPDEIEAAFNRHQWTGSWTGGVYDYHHYHSNTHEVLGVKAGQATVLIGGDQGERLELHQGDVILLPAGTGHKNAESSPDFEVVGAYPGGTSPNMKKKDPSDRVQALAEIKNVPVPQTDPVYGDEGPMLEEWKE